MTEPVSSNPAFEALRPRLFGIGYRMLGSVADAEDTVQEAYLRWHESDASSIENLEAWLVSVVTRLAIDRLRRAAVERTQYVGDWLPEPLPTDARLEPERQLELGADLSMAFLLMLDRLSSLERAVLVLRDVFDYDYAVISESIGKSEAATRQLLHRARERVRPRPNEKLADNAHAHALTTRFFHAMVGGDQQALLELLSPDVRLVSDGGGKVRAGRKAIVGADRVSRFFLGIRRKFNPSHRLVELNGAPAWVTFLGGKLYASTLIEISDGRISGLYRVLNPDKLKRIRSVLGDTPEPV